MFFFSEHDWEARRSSDSEGELYFDGPVQNHQAVGVDRAEEVRRRGHPVGHRIPQGEDGGITSRPQVLYDVTRCSFSLKI